MRDGAAYAVLATAATLSACVALYRPVPVEPGTTFTAHREHAGIAIDDLGGGRRGKVGPASWLHLPGEPTFAVLADGKRIAAIWREGWRFVVRSGPARDARPVGEVAARWEQQAVQLTLQPAGGPTFTSDTFVREGGGTGFETLTRAAQTNLDVRGTYRAAVHDAAGVSVGWLRVRITPYQEAARIFDATLLPAITPELVATAVVALDTEIDWIEDHTLDVYRGTSGGSLEHSMPSPR